jgi:hypothetical protein
VGETPSANHRYRLFDVLVAIDANGRLRLGRRETGPASATARAGTRDHKRFDILAYHEGFCPPR